MMRYGLPDRTLETIKAILGRYPGIQSATLYGSRAKGNYKTGSDIDLTLGADDSFSHADLLRVMNDFDDSDLPYTVDVSIFRAIDNENLKAHIQRVGEVLYQKDAELFHV
jgi:predicted nucleotidyltransferase